VSGQNSATRWFLALLILDLEDGGDTFLQNVGSHRITRAMSQNMAIFCYNVAVKQFKLIEEDNKINN
jgi:hypothetical protein